MIIRMIYLDQEWIKKLIYEIKRKNIPYPPSAFFQMDL